MPKNFDQNWEAQIQISYKLIIQGMIYRLVRNFDRGPSDRLKKDLLQMKISSTAPPQSDVVLGGGSLFICNLMRNRSWEKILYWKLLDNISISGLKKN